MTNAIVTDSSVKFRLGALALSFSVISALAAGMTPAASAADPTCADILTAWNPIDTGEYEVATANQLYCIGEGATDPTYASLLASDFIQTQNINAAEVTIDGVTEWRPIGGESPVQFTGTYNGGGHEIANLTFSDPTSGGGLFGQVGQNSDISNPTIINHLTLTNVVINGLEDVGGLMSIADSNVYIDDVHVTGSVSATGGYGDVGGLIGWANGESGEGKGVYVSDSSFEGTVTAGAWAVGGMVGWSDYLFITRSISDAQVTQIDGPDGDGVMSGGSAGGLVGHMNAGGISDSLAVGTVEGTEWTGGLGGYIEQSNVENSGSIGSVAGTDWVGGLGGQTTGGTVSRSYSRALVTGTGEHVGGLVGDATDTAVSDVYASGNVSDLASVGGLIGSLTGTSVSVSRSYSTGSVSREAGATADTFGGLAGSAVSEAFIDRSFTSGSEIAVGDYTEVDPNASAISVPQIKALSTYSSWNTGSPIIVNQWLVTRTTQIWGLCDQANDGYPFLQWELTSNPCTGGGDSGDDSGGGSGVPSSGDSSLTQTSTVAAPAANSATTVTTPATNPERAELVAPGVTLVSQQTAENTVPRSMKSAPATKLGSAPIARARVAQPVALVANSLVPNGRYEVKLKVNGSYASLGTVTSTSEGLLTIPVFMISRPDMYTIALIDESGKPSYIKLDVTKTRKR